jgi:hypothetical protein
MLGLLSAGCEEEPRKTQTVDAGAQDSGPSQPLLGGKLGEAVAAAGASATVRETPAQGGSATDGPPEKGIFEPAAADKAHPRGAPPKIEMLGQGSEPRAAIAAKLEPGATRKVVLTLGLRAQTPIDVDFAVAFKIDKPKDDKAKKGAEGAASASAAGAVSGASVGGAASAVPAGLPVIGKIASAGVSMQQGAPEELAKLFAKLKGSQIRFTAAPDGSARDLGYEIAKDADAGLETILQGLVEALSLMLAPLPATPVGVGAYWMVTDRASTSGIDVLRYRVFRVTKMEGGQASLSVEIRQYAADDEIRVPGAQQAMTLPLDRFESRGKGDITWKSGASFLAESAEVTSQLQALVIPPGQANQRGQVQTEVRLKLAPEP